MKTSISADHPFGVEKIVVHRELCGKLAPERIIIDPEDPASVIDGLRRLVGSTISLVVEVDKKDPRHAKWVQAVTNGRCLLSFKDWCEE